MACAKISTDDFDQCHDRDDNADDDDNEQADNGQTANSANDYYDYDGNDTDEDDDGEDAAANTVDQTTAMGRTVMMMLAMKSMI